MYDIEMFPKVFAEGEILAMSDDFLYCLNKLLDDMMSFRLLKFFDQFEKSGIANDNNPVAYALTVKIAHIKEVLMPSIKLNTFHEEVKNKGVIEYYSRLNIETALQVVENYSEAVDTLTWLFNNRRYWKPYIDPRQKLDYEEFLVKCRELVPAAESMDGGLKQNGLLCGLKRYPNLIDRVKANKELFFVANEKKRTTRMSVILGIAPSLEIILHGLKYQVMCDNLEVRRLDRRIFVARD